MDSAYSSAGDKVETRRRADFHCGKDWWKFLKSEGDLHAKWTEAQNAISERRQDFRVKTRQHLKAIIDARKADGTQVPADPEPPMWEERKDGEFPENGDQITYNRNISLQAEVLSVLDDTPADCGWRTDVEDIPAPRGSKCGRFTVRARYESPRHVAWSKRQEDKFAEVPEWCPPLLEGDVPLGMGNAFKRLDKELHMEIHRVTRGDSEWDTTGWRGTFEDRFYAAPRHSAVAILNYPWLKDETNNKPSPGERRSKKPFDLLLSDDEIVGISVDYSEEYNYETVDDAAIDILRKHGKWSCGRTDTPKPLAPRKPTLTEAFNVIIEECETQNHGVCDLHRLARQLGLKIRAVEGRAK